MRRSLLLTCALAVSLTTSSARADVYRWTDEDGRTHFDDDATRVPQDQRDSARVFQSKARPQEVAPATGPTQSAFAEALARELGLQTSATQDPVSLLQIVGIYPSTGWYPASALSSAVVQQVVTATRAAARARRLAMPESSAEAAAIRVASGLGVATPPPAAPPEPPPAPAVVVAPNIIVEAPPPPTVVVTNVQPAPQPILSGYPTFAFGLPFAPLGPVPFGPVPDRIVPLSNPAGRLHGPLITPLQSRPFQRPTGP